MPTSWANLSSPSPRTTRAVTRTLLAAAAFAVVAVLLVGGAIGTGQLLAVTLSNAGGAWDNAKKHVEDGHLGGRGSPAHTATVIGDTVGDPFKDTAGPALNPLLKVMNLVAVLLVPSVLLLAGDLPVRLTVGGVAVLVIVVALVRAARPTRQDCGRDTAGRSVPVSSSR